MLDFEQQANQAQALASLDEDWHLLEGECTTFAIFRLYACSGSGPRRGQWRRRERCAPGKTCVERRTAPFTLPNILVSLSEYTGCTETLHATTKIIRYT